MGIMLLKALLVWSAIAAAEVLHGLMRVRLLNRRIGDHRARQIGVFTGSALIFAIAWFTTPWIDPRGANQQLAVGFLWLLLMLAFEVAFGRLVFRMSWQRITADFDFRKGGLLALGMLVMVLAPLVVAQMRGME